MIEEKTLEMIRSLAAQLTPDERLELIRAIIETIPTDRAIENKDKEVSPVPQTWSIKIREEATYWYARSAEERQPYLGQYVAVRNKTVVDHDADRRALYLRIQRRFPDTPVLLVEAEALEPREFTILSPHLDRTVQF